MDKLLDEKLQRATGAERQRLERLYGKTAIANARLAYQSYKRIFSGPRWEALAARGARRQRLLWASTSVKNPRYRDVMYVEELIGADTIDTMPVETLAAFREHGRARASLEADLTGRGSNAGGAGGGRDLAARGDRRPHRRGHPEVPGAVRQAAGGAGDPLIWSRERRRTAGARPLTRRPAGADLSPLRGARCQIRASRGWACVRRRRPRSPTRLAPLRERGAGGGQLRDHRRGHDAVKLVEDVGRDAVAAPGEALRVHLQLGVAGGRRERLRVAQERYDVGLLGRQVGVQQRRQARDDLRRGLHRRRQPGERALALLQHRIDLAVVGEQAVDHRRQLGMLLPSCSGRCRCPRLVVAVQRAAVSAPLLAQRADPGVIAGGHAPESARELRDVAAESVVRRHERGRHRGGAVVVQQIRRLGLSTMAARNLVARGRSVSTRPSGWPTSTYSAVPRNSPVSTTPGIDRAAPHRTRAPAPASASGAGSATSTTRLPLSLTNGRASPASARSVGRAAELLESAQAQTQRHRDDLDRDRSRLGQRADQLLGPDHDHLAVRRRRDDALAHERAAASLQEIEVGRDLVRAVDGDVQLARPRRARSAAGPAARACRADASDVATQVTSSPAARARRAAR